MAVPAIAGVATLEDGSPQVAGFKVSGGDYARLALEQLDRLLRRGHFGLPDVPRTTLMTPVWVDGASLPASRCGGAANVKRPREVAGAVGPAEGDPFGSIAAADPARTIERVPAQLIV